MNLSLRSILGICLLPAMLAGCAGMSAAPAGGGAAPASSARVTGTVTYLQRIALPPSATIKVQLIDVSRADAPAIVLGEQILTAGGKQVPFSFEIPYDLAKIDQRFSYAVSARIEDGGKLLFINDQRYAVITRGAPNHVDMVLRAVGAAAPK
jgi:putative lipoprotein